MKDIHKPTDATPSVIRVPDVAKALGVHAQTVRVMVRRGDLPKPRRIGRGHPFWLAADLASVVPMTISKAA